MRSKAEQAGLAWEIDSAGTNGFHVGEAPHHLSQKVAKLNGIDISDQRARQFVKEDLDRFDVIYAMAGEVLYEMEDICGDRWPSPKVSLMLDAIFPGKNADVPDPWYGPEPGYHDVFDLLDKACSAIIKQHLSEKPIKQTA